MATMAVWYPIELLKRIEVTWNLSFILLVTVVFALSVWYLSRQEVLTSEIAAMEHWIGGLVALLLMVYLVYALLRPEKF